MSQLHVFVAIEKAVRQYIQDRDHFPDRGWLSRNDANTAFLDLASGAVDGEPFTTDTKGIRWGVSWGQPSGTVVLRGAGRAVTDADRHAYSWT